MKRPPRRARRSIDFRASENGGGSAGIVAPYCGDCIFLRRRQDGCDLGERSCRGRDVARQCRIESGEGGAACAGLAEGGHGGMIPVLRFETDRRRRAEVRRPVGERRLLRAEQAQHGEDGDEREELRRGVGVKEAFAKYGSL